jgi:LmbE family N-acetylglucosaminyl deacetylase
MPDAAYFCGGQVIKFVEEGWRVVMVRVTNDETDSLNLSREETIRINTAQMCAAAKIMGITEIVELGYVTDCLGDVSRVELREKFIRLFRQHRPYAVMSVDPYAQYEPNLDHVVVSQAVEEAYWTATFDKHHPEHLEEGLKPHSVCERWYYARQLPAVNCAIDVSDVLERRIDALCAHGEMMRNTLNQLRLQLATWGGVFPCWMKRLTMASCAHSVDVAA